MRLFDYIIMLSPDDADDEITTRLSKNTYLLVHLPFSFFNFYEYLLLITILRTPVRIDSTVEFYVALKNELYIVAKIKK